MKKLTFALACASTFALFAAIDAPKADFENYTEETGWTVANRVEPGSQSTYWLYEGASGSEDGSTVKAYGGENLAAPAAGGQNYLELSTEGGTLWRSLAAGKTDGEGIADKLGDAHTIDSQKGLYIDTMVQFTPTEDGGAPETTGGDKLAIWLNVETGEGLATPVTNLCVKANAYTLGEEGPMAAATTFPLVPADGSALSINPGTWYRLTVKAVANALATDENGIIPAFEIRVDGALMKAASGLPFSEVFGEFVAEGLQAAYGQNALFPSLQEMGNAGASITLQAVGFKGSGALDNLSISETEPQPTPGPEEPTPVTPQITLSATEATFSDSLELPTVTVAGDYVQDTDYTVSWDRELPKENPSADVVLTVTVTMRGNYSGSNTATFTVKRASTPPEVNDWPSDPTTVKDKTAGEAYGITGDLAGVPADKLAIWAKANGVSYAGAAGAIKIEAYLLNCANTDDAITEAKADFKIPSITIDVNGTVTVTSPDPDGSKYNGVITIKGSETVNGNYTLEKVDGKFPENARFFKAYLSVK